MKINFSSDGGQTLVFKKPGGNMKVEGFSEVIEKTPDSIPTYEGEYEVIPDHMEQTLETARKMMKEDVKVKKIPSYEVRNDTGFTFYVGKEIE